MRADAKSPEQVRKDLKAAGLSVGAWARANGFNRALVYDVLKGRIRGEYGQGHRIAVALGLKDGVIVDADQFRPARPTGMREVA